MELNRNELITGAIFGISFVWILGVYALALAPIAALLWALGGSVKKAYRRIGVPVAVAIFLSLVLSEWIRPALTIPGAFGILSIGYGIPSTQPPDAGSVLGRFFFKLSPRWADVLTRGSIFVMLALNYFWVAL